MPQQGLVYKVMFTINMNHHMNSKVTQSQQLNLNSYLVEPMLPLGILTSIVTLRKNKTNDPCLLFLCRDLSHMSFLVAHGRCCTADAESTGLLTGAYLTSHIFQVLYFPVSNSNCTLYLHSKWLFIHFSCLSVP